jgi:hypothetical protein
VRYQNLYTHEFWRRNMISTSILLVVYVGILAYIWRGQNLVLILAYAALGALLVFSIYGLYRSLSYVRARETGLELHWHVPFRSTIVAWDLIRNPKVAPLKAVYPKGARGDSMAQALLEKPALHARLAQDADQVARITRRLGRRYVFEGSLAVPVSNPQALAEEVSKRLPSRSLGTPNLGGARRRKRRR